MLPAMVRTPDGVLDLGVAPMVGLQCQGFPLPVGDEASDTCRVAKSFQHARQSGLALEGSVATGHHAASDHAGRPGSTTSSHPHVAGASGHGQQRVIRIKPLVYRALTQLSPALDRMYADHGRTSIPPEHLLKACLLMALVSVCSERQFCERLGYDLLFNW